MIGRLVLFFVSSIQQLLDIHKRFAAILFCHLISALHSRAEMSHFDRQTREKKTLGFFFFLIDKNVIKAVESGTDMFVFNILSLDKKK